MVLDHTHIAVRERNFMEVLDLAVQVVRRHWLGLTIALAVGTIPTAFVNHLLLRGYIDPNEIYDETNAYSLWLIALMVLETPVATAPITLYLGQATFHQEIRPPDLVRSFFRTLPQMLWFQGFLRIFSAALFGVGFLIPCIWWPYLSEVVLLERNPMFSRKTPSRKDGLLTTWRRSRNLHRHSSGDLFSRWLGSVGVGCVLIGSLSWGIYSTLGALLGTWPTERTLIIFYIPLVGWIVMGFFAVVRFLAYLDLRIRREGWEVELTMRAEAARLASNRLAGGAA